MKCIYSIILAILFFCNCTTVSAQVIPLDLLIDGKTVPENWKDSLVKTAKWEAVEMIVFDPGKLINVNKIKGHYIFSDSTLEIISDNYNYHRSFFRYVRYFPDQHAIAVGMVPFVQRKVFVDQHGSKIIYLKDSLLVLEEIAMPYFDLDSGRILSMKEINDKAAAERQKNRTIWTYDEGVKQAVWLEWTEGRRYFQVYKAVP